MSSEQYVEYFRSKDLAVDVNEALTHVLEVRPEKPREALAAYLTRPRHVPNSCHIYAALVSGNSLGVVAGATAMKIPFELKAVDLMKGEHKQPALLALNPLGQVPTLHIPELDVKLGESCTILRTLANCYHVADHWYPIHPAGRAVVDRFLDWRQTVFYQNAAPWLYHCVGFHSSPDAVKKRAVAVEAFDNLLNTFVKGAFVNGAQCSIADISICSLLHFVPADSTFQMPEAWSAYWNRVKDACGRDDYDHVYHVMDGFVASARERNVATADFMVDPDKTADGAAAGAQAGGDAPAAAAPAPAAADAPAPAEDAAE